MANVNNVTDNYIFRPSVDDQMGPKVEGLAASLGKFQDQADKSAASAAAIGKVAADSGERFSLAAPKFEAYARKYDDVTRASLALASAERELQRIRDTGAIALATNKATLDQYQATVAGAAERISRLSSVLGAARADFEASAEVQAAWNTAVGTNGASAKAFATSIAAVSQATREGQIAFSAWAASIDTTPASLAKVNANLGAFADNLVKLRSAYDPLYASSKAYEAELARIDLAVQKTGLSEDNARIAREKAAIAALGSAAAQGTLRASYDDVFAASKRYESALAAVAADLNAGNIGAVAAAAAQDKITAAYAAANAPLATYNTAQTQQRAVLDASFAALDQYNAGIERQRGSLNSVFGVSKAYEAQLNSNNQLLAEGAIGAAEHAANQDRLTQAFAAANSPLSTQIDAEKELNQVRQASFAALDQYTASMEALRAKYDPIFAASKQYEATLAEIATAEEQAGLSSTNAGIARQKAAETMTSQAVALDSLRAKYDPIYASSKKYEQTVSELTQLQNENRISTVAYDNAMQSAGVTLSEAPKKATKSLSEMQFQTAGTTREIIVLAHEVIQGNFSRIPGSILVLGERIGGLGEIAKKAWAAIITPTGLVVTAVVAVTAAFAALGVVAELSQRAQAALSAQLSATREDYVAMANAVKVSAKDIASSTSLTSAEALTAATDLARIPGMTEGALTGLGQTLAGLARSMGGDIPGATKLMTLAFTDPIKAAEQMAAATDPMKAMTAATLNTVLSLQQLGDRAGATKLVMAAIADQSKVAAEQMTPLMRAWKDLDTAMHTTGDHGKSFAQELGEAIDNAVAAGVSALASLIKALQDARTAARNIEPAGSGVFGGIEQWLQGTRWGRVALQSYAPGTPAATAATEKAALEATVVHPTIEPFIGPAAAANGLDPALLARLQRSEGRWNGSGWDTSSAGAVGPMQVKPDTFAGMLAQPGAFPTMSGATNLADPQQNVQAGAALFAHLLHKYGDVKLAVLAYHDGETVMDKVLAGQAEPSQAALNQALKVTSGYTPGTGYAGRVNSGPPGANFNGSYGPQLPSPADAEQARLANAGVLDQAAILQQQATVNGLTEKLKELRAARSSLSDPAQVAAIDTAIAQTTVNLENAKDPTKAATDALFANARAADDVGAAAQRLLSIRTAAALQREQHPEAPISAVAEMRQLAAAQADMQSGLETQIVTWEDATAQQDKVTEAWKKGTAAGIDAEVHLKAYNITIQHVAPSAANFAAELKKTEAALGELDATVGETNLIKLAAQTDAATEATLRTAAAWDGSAASLDHLNNVEKARAQTTAAGITDEALYADSVDRLTKSFDASSKAGLQMQQTTNSVNVVTGAATQAFTTIGNAITQAFVQGQGAAVNWGNVMRAVLTQVIQKIAELAILNPILNQLFGTNSGTLGTALSVFSGANSNPYATSSASGSSGGGLLSTGSSLVSGASTVSGWFGGPTISGTLGEATGLTGAGGSLTGAGGILYGGSAAPTSLLQANSLAGVYETGATGAGAPGALGGTLGGASLGAWAGGIGGGFALGSLAGGLIQSSQNRTGPAPTIGAGVGAVGGAVIGTLILPGIGTVLGGLLGGTLGGAGGGFIGPHTQTSYSTSDVNTTTGQFNKSKLIYQKDPTAIANDNIYNQQVADLNTLMFSSGVKVNPLSQRIQFGDNNPGGFQDPTKFMGFNQANVTGQTAFSQFRFSSDNQILQDKLTDKSFQTTADFNTYLTGFTAAQKTTIAFLTDMTAAMKGLGAVTGSVPDTIKKINDAYAVDKTAADSVLNTDYLSAQQTKDMTKAEADLITVRDRGIKAVNEAAQAAVDQADANFTLRQMTVKASSSGSPSDALAVQLFTADRNAVAERASFKAQLVGLYGDVYTSTAAYGAQMAMLETTLGQERVAIVAAANKQIEAQTQAIATQGTNYFQRMMNAQATLSGNASTTLAAQLQAFDTAAANERAALKEQEKAAGPAGIAASYRASIALELALGQERLVVQKQANDAIVAAHKQATDAATSSATSFITALKVYAQGLATGPQSILSPAGKLAAAQADFSSVKTKSDAGDAAAMGRIQTSASTLLGAAQSYYGSSAGYVAVYNQVVDAIKKVSDKTPDQLTASFLALQTQTQTTTLVAELQALRKEVKGLRADVSKTATTPLRLVA